MKLAWICQAIKKEEKGYNHKAMKKVKEKEKENDKLNCATLQWIKWEREHPLEDIKKELYFKINRERFNNLIDKILNFIDK